MGPDFESLGSVGGAILATGLIFAASFGLGQFVSRSNAPEWRRAAAAHLTTIAAGLTMLGWLTVVLGLSKWLTPSLASGIVVVPAIGGLAAAILVVRRVLNTARATFHQPIIRPGPKATAKRPGKHAPVRRVLPRKGTFRTSRWTYLLVAGLAGFLGVVTLGPALCYPTGWDELVYHHELPNRWLADGWPAVYLDLPYSGFPSLAELLFWLVAPIEHVITPRLLMWGTWVLALLATFLLLRRRLNLPTAAALTSSFALSGAVLMISANCYVESLLLFYAATLLLALETRFTRSSVWGHAAILGILAGGAAATKLTGLAVAILPVGWYALQCFSRRLSVRRAAAQVAMFALVATAIALPFYLRPWLETGNPFYPYYAQWFTEHPAALETSRFHHALGSAFGVQTANAFVTAPLLLAFDTEIYDGAFGWQLVLILGLAMLATVQISRTRRRFTIVWPALIAIGLYVFWFFTAQQARFVIPAVLGLTILAAEGLRHFPVAQRRWTCVLLVVLTLASLPYRNAGHYLGSWMTALGLATRADYVAISTAGTNTSERVYLPLVRAIGEHTPAGAKLLVLFEHRVYYMPRHHEIGTPLFQQAHFTPPEDFREPALVLKHLRDRQFTHIVLTNAPAGPDQVPASFDRLEHFLPCFGKLREQGHLAPLWSSERYLLLKIEKEPAPPPAGSSP